MIDGCTVPMHYAIITSCPSIHVRSIEWKRSKLGFWEPQASMGFISKAKVRLIVAAKIARASLRADGSRGLIRNDV